MQYAKHFVPLESDPEIFTDLMHDLGGSKYLGFIDVWSLESDMLAFIPRPVLALILILPPHPAYELHNTNQMTGSETGKNVVWLKQTIHNACGLYAILHALCNLPQFIGEYPSRSPRCEFDGI